jgi:hypothetical protein
MEKPLIRVSDMRAGERREERIKKMPSGLGKIFFESPLDVATSM